MNGKNFNYYLIDGSPLGRIKCTLSNWTGVAYKIPRIDLKKSRDREHLQENVINDEREIFRLEQRDKRNDGKMTVATAIRTNEGFVVQKGSDIRLEESMDISRIMSKKRKDVKKENHKIMEDVLFDSPSYAAMFVLGTKVNGRVVWKNRDGKTLKEIDEIE